MDALIGRQVSGFRVVRKIGEGGMGSVYLAERADGFEQTVAIKFLLEGLHSPESQARFRLERQVLASLQHPNIVTLLDGGITDEGIPYLVMDYVDGLPIDRYCEEHALPLEARLRIFAKVLGAVAYAHRQLILHCDLKPANILVNQSGEPMLLDFGVTKLLEPALLGVTESATRTTLRPFTPEFASPEQLRNAPLGVAADTYAAGLILYLLVTGAHPFEDLRPHPVALLRASLDEMPQPPTQRKPGTPSDVDAIIMKSLRKEPQTRYRTVSEFAEDLDRYFGNRPVSAREGSRRYWAWKFVVRHKQAAIAALLLLTVIAATGGAALWHSYRAQRSRTQASARFGELRKLTNALLKDYYESLAKLPGSTRAQQALVGWSTEYLDRLRPQASADPALRLEVADGYRYLASILGDSYFNNLGRPDEAIATVDKALAILPPNSREARLLTVRLYGVRGSAQSLKADTKAALADCRRSVELAEPLVKENPSDVEVLMIAASHYEQYADSHGTFTTGYTDIEKVRRLYDRSLELATQANRVDPKNPGPMRGMALLSVKTGDLINTTDPTAAIPYFERAIRGYEALPAEARNNWRNRRSLALAHGHLSEAYQRLGQWDRAAAEYRIAIPTIEAAQKIDPTNQQASWDLLSLVIEMGEVERERGNKAAAAQYLRRAIALAEPLAVAQMPGATHLIGQALIRLSENDCPGASCLAESARGLKLMAEGLDRPGADQAQWENVAQALLSVQPASLQNPAAALTALDRAATAYEQSPPYHNEIRAEALRRLGREAESVKVAQAGLAQLGAADSVLRRHLARLATHAPASR